MQHIVDWLKQLGVSEYAERFVESDIDTSVLRDLTDQDLKELGVSLGHQRKMLRAIAELASADPSSPHKRTWSGGSCDGLKLLAISTTGSHRSRECSESGHRTLEPEVSRMGWI